MEITHSTHLYLHVQEMIIITIICFKRESKSTILQYTNIITQSLRLYM